VNDEEAVAIRAKLKDAEILDQFDRVVSQSFEE